MESMHNVGPLNPAAVKYSEWNLEVPAVSSYHFLTDTQGPTYKSELELIKYLHSKKKQQQQSESTQKK